MEETIAEQHYLPSEMASRDTLRPPPNNCGILLAKDSQFVLSNKMLDAKIKQLKQDAMKNKTHKPAIELEDLESLKTVIFYYLLTTCRCWFGATMALKARS